MAFTAYKITCAVTGKIYIGITKRPLAARWQDHKEGYRDISKKSRLYLAMRKYGIECFQIESIAQTRTAEDLLFIETVLIEQFGSFVSGYNSSTGGDAPRGLTHSAEARKKLSISHTGKKQSPETIAKRVLKLIGRRMPARTEAQADRHRIAMGARNFKHSEEFKEKMREKMRSRVFTDEWKAKISAAKKGIPPSESTRKAHREKVKGQPKPPRSEQYRANLSRAITEWHKNRKAAK